MARSFTKQAYVNAVLLPCSLYTIIHYSALTQSGVLIHFSTQHNYFREKNKVTLVVSYQEHFVFVIYYHSTLLGILTKTEDRSDCSRK